MVDGRKKGNKYELTIARRISEWVCGEQSVKGLPWYQMPFRRRSPGNPMDGYVKGGWDLNHLPEWDGLPLEFPFCVEIKKHEGWELDGMFHCRKWKPWAWWEQAKEQAEKAHPLFPLLIFTRNRRSDYVLLYEDEAKCLGLKSVNAPVLSLEKDRERLSLATLDDLMLRPLGPLQRAVEES